MAPLGSISFPDPGSCRSPRLLCGSFRSIHQTVADPRPIRSQYAQQVNQVFWKLPAYSRDPAANILLGDSEMAQLPVQVLQTVTGQQYSNLAYGGGTLRESVSTFWFASRKVKLQKVLFGMSFMEYNPYPVNRVDKQKRLRATPPSTSQIRMFWRQRRMTLPTPSSTALPICCRR